MYQYDIDDFSLVDRSKLGHKTIVEFLLCDPTQKILSTTDVPPQQLEWMSKIFYSSRTANTESRLLNLPPELKEKILLELERDGVVRGESEDYYEQIALICERMETNIGIGKQIFLRQFSSRS